MSLIMNITAFLKMKKLQSSETFNQGSIIPIIITKEKEGSINLAVVKPTIKLLTMPSQT